MPPRTRLLLLAALVLARNAAAQTITQFALPTPGAGPFQITLSLFPAVSGGEPDGNLWFTETNLLAPKIGRITSAGTVTEFPLTGSPFPAWDITAGSDGNVWFTIADTAELFFSAIGQITRDGAVTLYPLPDSASRPTSIVGGRDGALWFTETIGNRIGRITTSGAITEFPLPTPESQPNDIAAGADGNIWFTEPVLGRIGRITPAGAVTEFSVPLPAAPSEIAAGPDGNLWFTDFSRDSARIGRITTAGAVSLFPLQQRSPVRGISSAPDGNLWFTQFSRIGRITPTGVVTFSPIPEPGDAQGITAGPDGAIWFTDVAGNKIDRITAETLIIPVVGLTLGANGTLFKTAVQIHNPETVPMAGRIVFHRSGMSASASDPAVSYDLTPGQTRTFPDLIAAMEVPFLGGIGSADIIVTSGKAPVAEARVFNDLGEGGTTGLSEAALPPEEALSAGDRGVLIVPSDLNAFRFNVGFRTLGTGAALTFTSRDAAGSVVFSSSSTYPADYHLQLGSALLSAPQGGSITISVQAGAAIFYGATVDNRTGDPSLQIARASP